MKLKKIFCLYIITALVNYPVSSFLFFAGLAGLKDFWEGVSGLISKAQEAADKANGIHQRFETDLFGDKTEAVLDYLVDKVDEMSQDIKDMNHRMLDGFSKIEDLIGDVDDKVHSNTLMDRVIQSANRIKDAFDTIQNYQKRRKPTKKRLEAFIATFIRGKGPKSVEGDLKDIFQSVTLGAFSKKEKNLLKLMVQFENKRFDTKCGEKESAQSTIYQFFFSIANIEMVGLSTLAYGFVLNEAEKSVDNITELASDEYPILIDQLTDRLNIYAEQFIQAMRSVSRQFRTCDPPMNQHSRNETFAEMSGLMQEVLYSEYKIKGHDTCSSSCEQVGVIDTSADQNCWVAPPGSYGADKTRILPGGIPESDYYCTTPRTCMGELSHCFTLWSVRYCFSDKPYKRYDWVTTKDYKNKYGVVDNCEGRLLNDWDWQRYWAYDCGYCMCLCYDDAPESKSVHTVSLKTARSDTKNNKVVVGMRFQVHDDVLHIQIKQDTVDTFYNIKNESHGETWIDLPSMKRDVYEARMGINDKLVDEEDFATVTRRTGFNFDEIEFPYGRVLTGVKFGLVKLDDGEDRRRIQIQAESMEYNHTSGELIQGTEEWTKPPSDNHDEEYQFLNAKRPDNTKEKFFMDSKTNQYSKFSKSNVADDMGQYTVPFFDIQTVESYPRKPLAGVGFHHRGTSDSPGFYGLTGYSISYADFLEENYSIQQANQIKDQYNKK